MTTTQGTTKLQSLPTQVSRDQAREWPRGWTNPWHLQHVRIGREGSYSPFSEHEHVGLASLQGLLEEGSHQHSWQHHWHHDLDPPARSASPAQATLPSMWPPLPWKALLPPHSWMASSPLQGRLQCFCVCVWPHVVRDASVSSCSGHGK